MWWLSMLTASVLSAEPAASTWSFEGRNQQAVTEGKPFGSPVYSDNIPNRFIYDPLTRKSRANSTSLALSGNTNRVDGLSVKIPPISGSWTLEGFLQPGSMPTQPNQAIPFLMLGNARLETFTSPPPHRYNWLRASVRLDQQTLALDNMRYGGMTMYQQTNPWRHHALVYDAQRKQLTYFLDYTVMASTSVPTAPVPAEATSLVIGSDPKGRSFVGAIDEVRFTASALAPSQFLHALPHALTNVSLVSPEGRLPRASGYADIRERFGAVGDGQTDDTHAFQKAFQDLANVTHLVGYQTLYIPDGTYLVSDTIRFSRYLTVQGQSREKTIIRLRDSAIRFSNASKPRPVLSTGFSPYEENIKDQKGGNVTHGVYVFDLTIDTGKSNPGAIGFDYQGHNNSAVARVTIRSGDGQGVTGLDLNRPWPGPCLIKDLTIEGFDYGIQSRHNEYSMTFSRITLTKQNQCGIFNQSNGLAIENLTSTSSKPVVRNLNGGQVVLINSKLTGGAPSHSAIENGATASLLVRNTEIQGYGTAIKDGEQTIEKVPGGEYVSGKALAVFDVSKKTLNLPVEPTPEVPWHPLKDWVNVREFEDKVKGSDWSAAIQTAIDSGAKTVYFPVNGASPRYHLEKPVHVRGSVERLLGMFNSVSADEKALAGQPAWIFDGPQKTVSIERLVLPSIRHVSGGDLVIHCGSVSHITAEAGCGKLFLEDYMALLRVSKHQRVWARHLNIESKDTKIINEGGRLWVLGYKTEGAGMNLVNRQGAQSEILGGLMYVTQKPPAGIPMFMNHDSDVSVTCLISGYVGFPDTFMKETRGEVESLMRVNKAFTWLNGRPLIHLYSGRK